MDVPDAERGKCLVKDGACAISSDITTAANVPSTVSSQSSEVGTSTKPQIQEKDNIQRRLESFVNWIGNALPIQLAIAGFMFTGQGDKVQCVICKVKLYNWEKDMVPLDAHRKHSPNCRFLQKWFPSKSTAISSTGHNEFNAGRAKYQDKVEMKNRLDTFGAWPLTDEIQSPQNMALAGFFSIGSTDRARCFNCGLTLRDWDTDDDPFAVHLQWAPKCEYIHHIHKDRRSMKCFPKKEEPKITNVPSSKSETTSTTASTPGQTPTAQAEEPTQASANTTNADGASSSTVSAPDSTTSRSSTQFEAVMAMGFQPELIQRAIDEQISKTGDGFPNVTSLYLAVEELECV